MSGLLTPGDGIFKAVQRTAMQQGIGDDKLDRPYMSSASTRRLQIQLLHEYLRQTLNLTESLQRGAMARRKVIRDGEKGNVPNIIFKLP